MQYFMGIDIGGTTIKGIILEEDLKEVISLEVATKAPEGQQIVCSQMEELIDAMLQQSNLSSQDITAMGMGIPGVIDKYKRVLKHSGNLHLEGVEFVAALENKYHIPITIENDANVAALGEFTMGAGKGTENMIILQYLLA